MSIPTSCIEHTALRVAVERGDADDSGSGYFLVVHTAHGKVFRGAYINVRAGSVLHLDASGNPGDPEMFIPLDTIVAVGVEW